MDRKDYKTSLLLITLIGGVLWWINSGFSQVIKIPAVELYIEPLRGHGFFSIESTMLVILLAFLLVFPISVWFFACIVFFSSGSIEKSFLAKSIGWAILSPILFLGLVLVLFIMRVITSLAGWLLLVSLVVVFVFGIVKLLIQLLLKR